MEKQTDLLIIGGGVAGLYAALCARSRGMRVVLVCKRAITGGSTYWAQGGVAAPLAAWDEEAHARDTLTAGRGLSDETVVREFVREAHTHVNALARLGVPFAPNLAREGGHGLARIRQAGGDGTGRAISETLARQVGAAGVVVWEHAFARALLRDDQGRVVGADILPKGGGVWRVRAGSVLLATGGFGRAYPVTTAPREATGDGVALAVNAGAQARDMEFVQFHPTVVIAGSEGLLVTEAARGAGGVLRNAHGHRFMTAYDPHGELAPRDVVARSIHSERRRTGNVTLDLSHLGAAEVRSRFPNVHARLLREGLDLARDPVPVQPAVHYTMGGVRTDAWARTTVPGLYAAGEVASCGLHGANRLASNSLSEGLVFGARAAAAAAEELSIGSGRVEACTGAAGVVPELVRDILARAAGLEREAGHLHAALGELESARPSRALSVQHGDDRAVHEAANLTLIGALVLRGALAREESRGAHLRLDFPGIGEYPYHVVQDGTRAWREPLDSARQQDACYAPHSTVL
ncbi:L-aspartate oxidase [Deinococcus peraridilitoris]|nr:FAD-dependent oxidoreductase [Deinococcus peraridilitoris]